MAMHQLRTAALENRPDLQEERVNLSGGRKKRSRMSWAELPIRGKSTIRRESLEGREGSKWVSVLGVVDMVVSAKEKETVESQKEVELGWRDERMGERKETG